MAIFWDLIPHATMGGLQIWSSAAFLESAQSGQGDKGPPPRRRSPFKYRVGRNYRPPQKWCKLEGILKMWKWRPQLRIFTWFPLIIPLYEKVWRGYFLTSPQKTYFGYSVLHSLVVDVFWLPLKKHISEKSFFFFIYNFAYLNAQETESVWG